MTTPDRLPAGTYLSPRHDGMVVMVDTSGFPRPVSEDYNTLISHNGEADHLANLWGPLTPAKVVPADAIVIPRSALPEVTKTDAHDQPARDHYVHHRDTDQAKIMRGKSAEKHRRWAAEHLALAEHLENAVDEAQVNALVDLMEVSDDNGVPKHYADIARRLVAAGVRAPQAGDDQ